MANDVFRVLIVDDDDGVREFTARALGRGGYEVATARDGLDALRIVESEPRFDLFVLDVMMPGMRGDQLAQRLHDRDPRTRVLYITGYADQFFALRPTLRSSEAILVKPVRIDALLEAVARRIQGA